MGFENDVFISYAHVDNETLAVGQDGWISLLHERLRIRLPQLLGEEVKIWRDPKLQGNDEFADTLVIRVSKAGVLLSVLSPRYIKSDWCRKEL
ncbi:MAG TPA: toll/interleukin-1 receptor domain-containing protein, partial [Blastocatellia bacterium]|nr:toll/interleukin-1 receptor domain-containing protein [Blastocatellia bacterium]